MGTTMLRQQRGAATRPRASRWRLLRRLLAVLLAVVIAGALALAVGWVATPGVDDAARRVATHLAAHQASALQGPVPTRLAEALIATEDSSFYRNHGVDPRGAFRALLGGVTGHDRGGSTLEQQLAKNLYEQGASGPTEKAAEVVLALKLDRAWSKQQLLRMYLDDGYYGHGFYGLTAATEGYFGEQPDQLSWAQASVLAGLFQAPSAYDPFQHPDLARARQGHVLDRLVAVGTLTRQQADDIAGQSWGLQTGG